MRSEESSGAGASARRAYEARKRAREERARKRMGSLGVALMHLAGEPWHQRAWRKGTAGEQRVAARLTRLLDGRDVELLHDRRVAGWRGNFDHLAVGPGGVTVIDAKHVSGKVRIEIRGGLLSKRQEILRIGGRDRTRMIDGLEHQIRLVRNTLADAGLSDVEVTGALCFPDAGGLPLLSRLRVRGLLIDGPRQVAKLAARAGPLDPDAIRAVHSELARRLRPA